MNKMSLCYAVPVLFLTSLGTSSDRLTLEEAIQKAVEKNFDLSLARDRTEIAANALRGEAGSFLPALEATATHAGTLWRDSTGTTLGVSADWIVFNGFQNYHGYRRQAFLEQSVRLEERQSLESLLETVVAAYYDIVQLKQKRAALHHLLAVSRERAVLSQARLDVGAGSRLENLQAQADLNADSSAYLDQGLALAQAKVRLNGVLARVPSLDFDVADSIPLAARLPLEEWCKGLDVNNSSIAAAKLRRSAAISALAAARGRWLPAVRTSLSFGAGSEKFQNDGFRDRNDWSYGVGLTVPLFDRLGTPTAVRNAKVEARSEETRLSQVASQVAVEFEQARNQYETSTLRIALEQDNLQVARQQADAAKERFRLGVSPSLEFRDAQTRLLEAEGRLISARQSAKQAETTLQRLAGYLVR